MDNSLENENLHIKMIRMWGILLIPQFIVGLRYLYMHTIRLFPNVFDFFIENPLQLINGMPYYVDMFFTIYFLFYGRKAAKIFQYFMDKWHPDYRNELAAHAARLLGLILLFEIFKDVILWILMLPYFYFSEQLKFNLPIIFVPSIILTIAGMFVSTWYLLFRGKSLLEFIRRSANNNSNMEAIKIWAVFLVPGLLMLIHSLISSRLYYSSFESNHFPEYKYIWFTQLFRVIYKAGLTTYLLFFGMKAAKTLGGFMNKWQEKYQRDPAAFFVRIIGFHIMLYQLEAIAKLIESITTTHQWHEFLEIYNLPGILNLSSLPEIITIAAWLLVSWYLLYRGQLVLNFINRPAKPGNLQA